MNTGLRSPVDQAWAAHFPNVSRCQEPGSLPGRVKSREGPPPPSDCVSLPFGGKPRAHPDRPHPFPQRPIGPNLTLERTENQSGPPTNEGQRQDRNPDLLGPDSLVAPSHMHGPKPKQESGSRGCCLVPSAPQIMHNKTDPKQHPVRSGVPSQTEAHTITHP